MGAVCKVCGKDMIKPRTAALPRSTLAARVTTGPKFAIRVISTKVRLPIPDAMTATHCSVTSIIGDAMRSAARLAAVR